MANVLSRNREFTARLHRQQSDGFRPPVSTLPGDTGPQGDPGPGVPAGGTTGQVLAKASDDDYDTEWVTP